MLRKQLHVTAALVAPCTLFFVLLNYQLPDDGPLYYELQNAGHALAFVVIAICVAFIDDSLRLRSDPPGGRLEQWRPSSKSRERYRNLYWRFFFCVLLGALIETIQSQIGRTMSWLDLMLDGLGTCAGLMMYRAFIDSSPKNFLPGYLSRTQATLYICSVFLLAGVFLNPLLCYLDLQKRDEIFPVLLDAESRTMDRFNAGKYKATISIVPAPQAWKENQSLVVKFESNTEGRWPSLALVTPVKNWQYYQELYFEIYSDEKNAQDIVLRINDAAHNNRVNDRFRRNLQLRPGLNIYQISMSDIAGGPKNRDLDLRQIQQVIWYVGKPSESRVFYFDNIKLR